MMMLHGGGSGVHLRGGHEVHTSQLTHHASKTGIHFNYEGTTGKLGNVPNLGTSLCRRRIDSWSFTSFITWRFGADAIHSKYFNSALSQLCRRAQLQRFAQRVSEEMTMLHGCTGLHSQVALRTDARQPPSSHITTCKWKIILGRTEYLVALWPPQSAEKRLGSQPHSSPGLCRRRDTVRVHCTSLKSRRETKNTKTLLSEDQMPRQWYNIIPDLPRPPPPPLHPGTLQPLQPQDLAPLFPVALIQQEATTDRYVDIPEEVLEVYKLWRPSPLFRAWRLEKLLDTPARIYYKYEGVSPAGSHKPNTAIPQAWYNAQEGIKRLTTETGAGQWGCALAFACTLFDLECEVWQVRASYDQKPYRKSMMETWGATVHPSPSFVTKVGQAMLAKDPNTPGSLGIAISEAVEAALARDDTRYALGSVLNHVLLHQTIIGEECLRQLEILGETPDLLVGCTGGGSNFAGLAFPFLREKLAGKMNPVIRAVEPAACPSLTRGVYAYDFGDTSGLTPLMKMHTLGHDFIPDPIHAGGLRYHGMAPLVSHVYELGLMEAIAIPQTECFEAALKFARTEGIIPAPEPTHAIAATIREALACKESGEAKVIVTALCGHGHFDLASYDKFLAGGMVDLEYPADKVSDSMSRLPNSCLQ